MKTCRGLTLIELVVAIAIVAILSSLAAPALVSFVRSTSVAGAVNTFIGDVRYARSEAIRRGSPVVMCRSDSPEATAPACGTGVGPGGNGWVSGWFIYQDLNNDGVKDAAEPILRVQAAIRSLDQIAEASTKIRFTPNGRLYNLSSASTWDFGSSAYPASVRRRVTVNLGGRADVVKGDGSAL